MLKHLSLFFYRIAVELYHFSIAMVSFFNEKAYKFTAGRLNQQVSSFSEKSIWFHCASLGEFEQAKPIINWCHNHLKNPIVITFFSPSGYSYKKSFPLARAVYYLPKDSPSNAKQFIKKINPEMAFFIKYEFWHFHLSTLHKMGIKYFLIAGIFRKDQIFFKSYGILHREMLNGFTKLFVQDENSLKLLKNIGVKHVCVASDTRFDTVKQISELNFTNEIIEEFIYNRKCLVVGSSWIKDEELILSSMDSFQEYKIIIAPHDVNPTRIKQIRKRFKSSTLISNAENLKDTKVLIIDNVGKLSLLYRYATLCYIGGGFGVSVHNVLEAAVYSKALMFGPNHLKSKEAVELKEIGAAKEVKDKASLEEAIAYYSINGNVEKASKKAGNYVLERTGGTKLIVSELGLDS